MEIFSALLALCAGNSPVAGEFPSQRPATRSFGVFFDLRLNKRLSKQSWGWWFEITLIMTSPECTGSEHAHTHPLDCTVSEIQLGRIFSSLTVTDIVKIETARKKLTLESNSAQSAYFGKAACETDLVIVKHSSYIPANALVEIDLYALNIKRQKSVA